MKKLSAFFVSLSLVLLLSVPIVMADEDHGGVPAPPGGSNIVLPTKGGWFYEVLSAVLNLQTIPLI